jgi:hypothetical protein
LIQAFHVEQVLVQSRVRVQVKVKAQILEPQAPLECFYREPRSRHHPKTCPDYLVPPVSEPGLKPELTQQPRLMLEPGQRNEILGC